MSTIYSGLRLLFLHCCENTAKTRPNIHSQVCLLVSVKLYRDRNMQHNQPKYQHSPIRITRSQSHAHCKGSKKKRCLDQWNIQNLTICNNTSLPFTKLNHNIILDEYEIKEEMKKFYIFQLKIQRIKWLYKISIVILKKILFPFGKKFT